jgi:hypothetical protein
MHARACVPHARKRVPRVCAFTHLAALVQPPAALRRRERGERVRERGVGARGRARAGAGARHCRRERAQALGRGRRHLLEHQQRVLRQEARELRNGLEVRPHGVLAATGDGKGREGGAVG